MFGVNPWSRIKVPITNEKDRQTYFGALNYQSKEFHVQSHPSGDGKSTVKFIKYLQNKYKNRKIIVGGVTTRPEPRWSKDLDH